MWVKIDFLLFSEKLRPVGGNKPRPDLRAVPRGPGSADLCRGQCCARRQVDDSAQGGRHLARMKDERRCRLCLFFIPTITVSELQGRYPVSLFLCIQ